jgi:hypothetical protein
VNKWLVILLIAFTWYVADGALDEHTEQITKLTQQIDTIQSDINFLRVENGVLWRKYQEWRYK